MGSAILSFDRGTAKRVSTVANIGKTLSDPDTNKSVALYEQYDQVNNGMCLRKTAVKNLLPSKTNYERTKGN